MGHGRAGLCLIIGWAVYLIARKKPITPAGCLLASAVGFVVSVTVMSSIPGCHRAYPWYYGVSIGFSALLLTSLVWCIIRYPGFRRVMIYFLVPVLCGAVITFFMTGVTEIIDGKGTVLSYLRIAACIALVLLINAKDIRNHFRKKKEDSSAGSAGPGSPA